MKFLAIALLLASCAQPNYANDASVGATGSVRENDLSAHCFANRGPCVTIDWEQLPTESDVGSFFFHTSPGDPALPPSVLLWMPSMGHGSSPVAVEKTGVGEYHATKVFFAMKGVWQLRFQLKEAREVKDEVILPFTF
jgi:hypothetical protein